MLFRHFIYNILIFSVLFYSTLLDQFRHCTYIKFQASYKKIYRGTSLFIIYNNYLLTTSLITPLARDLRSHLKIISWTDTPLKSNSTNMKNTSFFTLIVSNYSYKTQLNPGKIKSGGEAKILNMLITITM